ncbi:MAG: hypothetical protein AB1421_12740 [Pseudomonadota bacterium]
MKALIPSFGGCRVARLAGIALALVAGVTFNAQAAIEKSSAKAGVSKSAATVAKKARVAKKTSGATYRAAVLPVVTQAEDPGLALQVATELAPMPVTQEPVSARTREALNAGAAPAYVPRVNPYLVNVAPRSAQVASAPASSAYLPGGATRTDAGPGFSMPNLGRIGLFEQSILPKIQKVYPTGEKPLVVVTFKCPTELVGIDTPSTIILHKVVNGGMDLINKTNLLSFNMQQVCQ